MYHPSAQGLWRLLVPENPDYRPCCCPQALWGLCPCQDPDLSLGAPPACALSLWVPVFALAVSSTGDSCAPMAAGPGLSSLPPGFCAQISLCERHFLTTLPLSSHPTYFQAVSLRAEFCLECALLNTLRVEQCEEQHVEPCVEQPWALSQGVA